MVFTISDSKRSASMGRRADSCKDDGEEEKKKKDAESSSKRNPERGSNPPPTPVNHPGQL